jgi:hypothetical protein
MFSEVVSVSDEYVISFHSRRKTTVYNRLLRGACILIALIGCDNGAKQHQADQAQNSTIANELRKQGEAIQNHHSKVLPTNAADNDAP